ncbi:glycosyltransferase family 2 protein [Rhizomonospora bruguierae]|uniref:glycosyltransferase family 2 protein n=1 Tax=Rhizomonospora bruguierae TaxID=1581705 RepID=UPI001BCD4B58|nr:glycosyltransferase family 2 protein [Micromonospora sp. NBRC 107566]
MRDAHPYLPQPPNEHEKYGYFTERRGGAGRWLLGWLLVAALAVAYGYLRVATEAPWTTPALLLLPLVMLPVALGAGLVAHRPRTGLGRHRVILAGYRWDTADTVDIWVPADGEPLAALRNTCRAVADLRWHAPIMRYLLDDGPVRPEVERLALEHGFVYVRRREPAPGGPIREGERGWLGRTGNLINGFDASMGRYGVVFDAGVAPRPDFLWETVPYLQVYRRTAVVQTAPRCGVDPWLNYAQRAAGTLQEFFFKWLQPARDGWRAATPVGTNVVYRREAVRAVGGFARVPQGEDVTTAVLLPAGGWETRYVPLVLAKGVAPDSWPEIADERTRRCRAALLLTTDKRFQRTRLGWRARAAHWVTFLSYLASAGLLFTVPFPVLATVWGFPERVLPDAYLPLVPAMLAAVAAVPLLARGGRLAVLRLCLINSACHAVALADALRARVGQSPRRVSRLLRGWIVVTQVALWTGIAVRLPEHGPGPLWGAIVLAGIQLYVVAPLLAPAHGIRPATAPAHETAEPITVPLPQLALTGGRPA